MKILVVYYSRSGNSRKAAEAIAKQLGADVEEIHDTADRRGPRGFLRSFVGAMKNEEATITDKRRKHGVYDLVIVGGPVWVLGPSAPVAAYLESHKAQTKNVCFFCTKAISHGRVFRKMEAVCGKAPLATAAFGAMKDARAHKDLLRFVETVKRLKV